MPGKRWKEAVMPVLFAGLPFQAHPEAVREALGLQPDRDGLPCPAAAKVMLWL